MNKQLTTDLTQLTQSLFSKPSIEINFTQTDELQ